MLSFLGQAYERVEVDILQGENKDPVFRRVAPRQQVPVLCVEEPGSDPLAVWDSCAILAFLAAKHDASWLAASSREQAAQQQWLAIAAHEHQAGIRAARGAMKFGISPPGFDLQKARELGRLSLEMMDGRLAHSSWLAADRPTIADVACFPYASLAPDAGIDTSDLPHLGRWLENFSRLPRFAAQAEKGPAPAMTWSEARPAMGRLFPPRG